MIHREWPFTKATWPRIRPFQHHHLDGPPHLHLYQHRLRQVLNCPRFPLLTFNLLILHQFQILQPKQILRPNQIRSRRTKKIRSRRSWRIRRIRKTRSRRISSRRIRSSRIRIKRIKRIRRIRIRRTKRIRSRIPGKSWAAESEEG